MPCGGRCLLAVTVAFRTDHFHCRASCLQAERRFACFAGPSPAIRSTGASAVTGARMVRTELDASGLVVGAGWLPPDRYVYSSSSCRGSLLRSSAGGPRGPRRPAVLQVRSPRAPRARRHVSGVATLYARCLTSPEMLEASLRRAAPSVKRNISSQGLQPPAAAARKSGFPVTLANTGGNIIDFVFSAVTNHGAHYRLRHG